MPKGYWIMHVNVLDQAKYDAYRADNLEAIRLHGGRFLVRGGTFENPEGRSKARNVVIEFESYDTALACYRSAEYQAAAEFRRKASAGEILVVEGA